MLMTNGDTTLLLLGICTSHGAAAFVTSALLPQVALLKVKTTNNVTHLLTDALHSSPTLYEHILHCVFKTTWAEHLPFDKVLP